MKKNLLGISAVILALLASSFTTLKKEHKRLDTYNWFQISSSVNKLPSDQIPASAATFISRSDTPPSGMGCGGSTYLCVGGFTDDQVNGSNHLIDNSQVAADPASLKGN